MVLGIVVDDVDDARGEEVRAQFITDLRAAVSALLRESASLPIDPGRFEPIDIRVVLAFPSYQDGTPTGMPRFVSWVDEPELRWHADYRRPEDIDTLVDRVQRVVDHNVQPPNDTYRPLETLNELTRRVYATFCASFSEPGLFDDVRPIEANAPLDGYGLQLTVLTGRDDVDTPFGLSWHGLNYIEDFQNDRYVGCYPTYRVQATASAGDIVRLNALVQDMDQAGVPIYPYNLQRQDNPLWLTGGHGLRPKCHEWPYGQDAHGNWLCKYEVIVDAERCDETRGWRDPTVATTPDPRDGTGLRVCEVDQLAGTGRERCETDFECQDCAPGWCIPTLPELRPNECSIATTPWWQFRLVGASNAPDARHRVTCMR
jgi:hypothetical protein